MDETVTIEAGLKRALVVCPSFVHITSQLYPVNQRGMGGITADRFLRLYYDRKAIREWELDHVVSRIIVQVEQYYRRHMLRQKGREQVTWDVATEIAITGCLFNEGFRFPANTLLPETFKLPNFLTAEEYADRLYAMCSNRRRKIEEQLADAAGQELPTFGSAGSEELKEWELPEEENIPTIDAMVALMFQREMMAESSQPGKGSADLARTAGADRESAINWRTELRGIIGTIVSMRAGMSDYSFSMPDSDYGLHPGMIMPGMVGTKANLALVLDTSGSMGEDRLAQATAETGAVLKTYEGETGVFVYSCDAAVHVARTVFHTQQISLIGGGGTDMGAGIKAAASHFPRPDAIIVVTDGDTSWPKHGPVGIRVIVVLVGNGKAPTWAHKVLSVPMN